MNHFHYSIQRNGIKTAGKVVILMGLIVLAVPFLIEVETPIYKIIMVGGGALVIGTLMISISEGTLIDFETNKFKAYQSILWIKFGEWQSLPQIENAELIHYTYTESNFPNGISPTISWNAIVHKCVLVVDCKKFMVFDYSKEKDAIAALDIIRNGFKLS
ncbi:hypothetical protein [Algoriphagus sp. A40]|uniref:hypothetical protein n=1 Tax=Algoriphagus sp. A40 TaxID=1945863 RepID=UPI0009865B6A|nr:hypothetical protein [Algoriphagus sp. A40]OOG70662.1 hypothetical protein B0E43_18950 [Algoriphagus sp. A40]